VNDCEIVCDAPEDLDIFRTIGTAICRAQGLSAKADGMPQVQDAVFDF
jgi:hypothetical protein